MDKFISPFCKWGLRCLIFVSKQRKECPLFNQGLSDFHYNGEFLFDPISGVDLFWNCVTIVSQCLPVKIYWNYISKNWPVLGKSQDYVIFNIN